MNDMIVGVDLARPGGDKTVLIEGKRNPDGSITLTPVGVREIDTRGMAEWLRQSAELHRMEMRAAKNKARGDFLRAIFGVR